MGPVLRYSVLRLLVFLGTLCLLWLLGLRRQDQLFLLIALSLVLSMAVSFVLLRPFREELSARIAASVQSRGERSGRGERGDGGRTDDDDV